MLQRDTAWLAGRPELLNGWKHDGNVYSHGTLTASIGVDYRRSPDDVMRIAGLMRPLWSHSQVLTGSVPSVTSSYYACSPYLPATQPVQGNLTNVLPYTGD